ncbi:MFS transporter [Henriciella aquimarina]|uniref:MFS transporter n=1 Tax=Henriciella aquimarina TaxID=545261 RepID=UPI0009FF6344|nr:MFS transporter [Henriciella aquimarina]
MQKPKLSFGQIWNMCFGFLGIQIGFDLQNGNVSRIFQTLGASIDSLPILWIAAPLTGLIVQPIVGHFSDKTWGRLGRRRPYFLVGAVLASLALFVMPNSPALWVAAGTLWIMDASLNITMEPTRAFVGDMLPDQQRTTGYALQSFFIGLGAVIAGALPWLMTEFGVSNTAPEGEIPMTVHLAFYAGGAALFLAVLVTVLTTPEYSPEQMERFEAARREALGLGDETEDTPPPRSARAFYTGGLIWLAVGLLLAAFFHAGRMDPRPGWLTWLGDVEFKQDLYVFAALVAGFGVIQLVAGTIRSSGKSENGFMEVVGDLFRMPKTMRQLAVVQFFSWFGLFAMWIYGTPAVAEHHYGTSDAATALYQEAGNWWALLGAVRNGVAAAAALAIIWLAAQVDRRKLHAICISLGALGFAGMILIDDPAPLVLPMVGVGVAWAAIVSVPYAILAGSVPARKMGVYMGIFNIFIVVPQLVAATLLGFLLRTFFGNEPIWAFAIAAASFALAAIAVLFVSDTAEEASPEPIGAET